MSALAQFEKLRLQSCATTKRRFDKAAISGWCEMAGIPERYPYVPEPLIAGLFSYLLGERLPGHGTNYLKQSMHFENKAHIGEQLTATVTVTRLRPDKALVDLASECTGDDGRVICRGDSLVLFQR